MKNLPCLIFDFDGTLVDSFYTAIETFNLLAREYNFCRMNSADIRYLRNLTSRELIQQLEIPFYKIPTVLGQVRKHMQTEMPALPSFSTLPENLQKLHAANFILSFLTSNFSEKVIR